ncbi:hypothetical protein LCGC14_0346340 [marine sediment metagenome]|uniref:3D domain-containing protein n=1 Tax=marine sediment metagenome TaxID=412755 RepID=A0A0F9TV85_9ZZZZ
MSKVDKIAMISGYILFAITILIVTVWAGGKATECRHTPTQAPDTPQEQTSQIWRVTAYCPCKLCCGRYSDYVTASGHMIAHGDKFIAAPKSIPFGTWIDIKGYGYAEVLDRGGAIKGRRLDVFFPTHQEALNWGVRMIEVKL